jgi:oxygen-dependent protoporphyrinogen oxidase
VLVRAFVGGSLQEELFDLDDAEMERAVRQELGQLLGVRAAPLFVRVARYPHSMPQYVVGHLRLVSEIEQQVAAHPGLALAGSAYRGVGIADCVRSGEAAAEVVFGAVNDRDGKSLLSP